MEPFDLHVENHVRIQSDLFTLQDFSSKLFLFPAFDGNKGIAQILIHLRNQLFEPVKICKITGTDSAVKQPAKLRVAKTEPAALGDAVGFVRETLRPDLIPF